MSNVRSIKLRFEVEALIEVKVCQNEEHQSNDCSFVEQEDFEEGKEKETDSHASPTIAGLPPLNQISLDVGFIEEQVEEIGKGQQSDYDHN